MTDSSNPTVQIPGYMASSAAFSTNTDEAKILSYMWYIHVTLRVNAEDRLWDRLVQLLELGIPTTTATAATLASPPCSPQPDLDGINDAGSGSPGRRGDGAGVANEVDNLTDYLVLRHFSGLMFATLVKTAPIEEYTDGYARILAGVPAHFRVEFCRRLYCLLFSKYIFDWPSGIAAPEPAPGSIAAAAAAAAADNTSATASSTGSETAVGDACQLPKEEEDDKKDEFMCDMEKIVTDLVKDDYVLDSESHKCLVSPEPASPGYQSTLGPSSPWPDTPSLGYSPELARAAYFGTVSAPLPIQYLGECAGRVSRSSISSSSSRDDGPARAACAGAGASAERHDERLPTPSWNNRSHPAAPGAPPQQQQQHATNPQEGRPASLLLLRSAHSRDQQQQVSHTGSSYCPCRAREAWSHGAGGPR